MRVPDRWAGRLGGAGLRLWLLAAAFLLAAPWLFPGGWSLTLLSQMGIAVVACLSFNILLGQGGLLSFGHAVYSGLGAYLAIHVLNWGVAAAAGASTAQQPASSAAWWWVFLPVLLPLVGGLGGWLAAALLGWLSTRQGGTVFAMVTLALGELVLAVALMVPGVFGGEGGVSGNRVLGQLWGISFGPAREVYFLIAAYAWLCALGMWAFTQTTLGRLLNAQRDQAQRLSFIGQDQRQVRHRAFMVSGFFAGVAGGLAALWFEIVTTEALSIQRSGAYLLFTVMGGVGFFVGPVIGGVLLVLCSLWLAELTPAWPVYLGLAFLLVVMFAPGGVAELMARCASAVRGLPRSVLAGPGLQAWRWVLARAAAVLAGAVALAGFSALVEMAYHWQLGAAVGPAMRHLGAPLDVQTPGHWWAALALTFCGGLAVWWLLKRARLGQAAARPAAPPEAEQPAPDLAPAPAPAAFAVSAACARGPRSGATALGQAAGLGLELLGLHKRLGKTDVIRGVDLLVHPGERLALIGPNGAGKSTLFDLISGRFAPDKGSICLQGQPIQGLQPQHIHRLGLSRSFQITRLFGQLSVRDNLRCAALSSLGHGPSAWQRLDGLAEVSERADAWMEAVELGHRSSTPARALSYAEQRALELGVTLVSNPAVVLLDEPTAGMSLSDTRRFTQLIRRATQGRTLLTVEHDMGVVFDLADRVAVLVAGVVLAVDTPERIRTEPQVQEAYLRHG